MAECPNCASALSTDFGMISCASCGSMLFIDMDGVAHISGSSSEPSKIPSRLAGNEEPEGSLAPADAAVAEGAEAAAAVAEAEAALLSESYESPLASLDDGEQQPSFSGPSVESPGLSSGSLPLAERLPEADFEPPSAEDPLGLNAFANSEISQAKDGPLVFRLLLSGIDSKEMRESIREALVDARFGWDASAVMSRISKGRLAIEGLSPIKATVLVNRLKRLPIRIAWEQYAVTQLEALPEPPQP